MSRHQAWILSSKPRLHATKLSSTSCPRDVSHISGKQVARLRSATRARDFILPLNKRPSRLPSRCLADIERNDSEYSMNTSAHEGHSRRCHNGDWLADPGMHHSLFRDGR